MIWIFLLSNFLRGLAKRKKNQRGQICEASFKYAVWWFRWCHGDDDDNKNIVPSDVHSSFLQSLTTTRILFLPMCIRRLSSHRQQQEYCSFRMCNRRLLQSLTITKGRHLYDYMAYLRYDRICQKANSFAVLLFKMVNKCVVVNCRSNYNAKRKKRFKKRR